MKRWLMLGLFALCAIAPLRAQEINPDDVRRMAAQMPPVDVFVVLRTDSARLQLFDALALQITSRLPESITSAVSLRDLINQGLFAQINLDLFGLVNAWLGDTVAFGLTGLDRLLDDDPTNDEDIVIYAAADVTNRTLALTSLRVTGLLSGLNVTRDGDRVTYRGESRLLRLDGTSLFFINGRADVPNEGSTLADTPAFGRSLATLPRDDYGLLLYEAESAFLRRLGEEDVAIAEILAALGLEIDALGPVVGGFTVGNTGDLLLDVAQERRFVTVEAGPAVDPDFLARLPASADVVLHTTDLDVFMSVFSGLIASISASDTPESVYARFETLVELLLGLDLRQDILRWASGDYGVMLQLARPGEALAEDAFPVQLGLAVQVSDVDAAQNFVDALAQALPELLPLDATLDNAPIVLVEGERDRRVDVWRVRVPLAAAELEALEHDTTLEILMGVTSDLLFVATHDLTVDLLSQRPRLSESEAYQRAQAYDLPDATLTFFTLGTVPDGALDWLLASSQPLRDLLSQADPALTQALDEDSFGRVVRSTSLSLRSDADDSLLTRLVVILEE